MERFRQQLKISAIHAEPVAIRFIEGLDKEWSGTAPRGLAYWRTLKAVLDEEPVREQDKPWIAMLEPLGLRKGQPFEPDARQAKLLRQGAALGELMTRNLQVNPRYAEPYWEGTQWYKSFDFSIPQVTDTKVELDERATWFYEAVTSTEEMVNPKHSLQTARLPAESGLRRLPSPRLAGFSLTRLHVPVHSGGDRFLVARTLPIRPLSDPDDCISRVCSRWGGRFSSMRGA
ncbi:hypothetical protein Pla108_38530 [Botrimarina colliarenosi]|uniref:Uncharacterized protein n=1 Tax=Botrimarina colliarenosi TaxID=2528001 RepID=A0A5C6A408_9BACT|nr:hypothetical protein [Botrimarina colliarenosi]TWT94140.1 hypothetical protein Pla108_38530 [Botrimarina colliarenosi]